MLDAAKDGDELALEVMDVVGRYLGLALSMVVMTVDPEIFVIGGRKELRSRGGKYCFKLENRSDIGNKYSYRIIVRR